MLNFHDRLKEERLKLGLNQQDFAVKANVSKTTQFNYEKGDRQPDTAYLSAIAELGIDVQYLITGSRSLNFNASSSLDLKPEPSPLVGDEVVAKIKDGIAEMHSTLNLAAKAMGVDLSESPTAAYDLEHMMSNQADMALLKEAIMALDDLEHIDIEAEYRPEDKARAVIAVMYSALKKGDRKIDPDIAAAVLRGSV